MKVNAALYVKDTVCSLNQMQFWSHSKGYGTTKPQLRYTRYWSCIDSSPESPLHRKPFLRHSRMPFLSVFDLQKWTDRKACFYHLNRAKHSRTCTRDSKNLPLRRKTKAFCYWITLSRLKQTRKRLVTDKILKGVSGKSCKAMSQVSENSYSTNA